MKYKIDLHTHSILSPDGGLSEGDYRRLLKRGIVDVIAITDHNRISFAQKMHEELGERIIVGEEIWTNQGEIIGLYLTEVVSSGLSAVETILRVKQQGGLVCIPHPFEITRRGLAEDVLREMIESIDLIEVFNGRSLEPATRVLAQAIVKEYDKVGACNSDAHCPIGIGRTYSRIADIPTKATLVRLLRNGERHEQVAPWMAFLCPVVNRLRHVFV